MADQTEIQLEAINLSELKKIRNYKHTIYSDIAIVIITPEDIKIEFGQKTDEPGIISVDFRVALNHYHAKRLLNVLSENIKIIEKEFGFIEPDVIKRMKPRTKQKALQKIKDAKKSSK